MLLKKHLLLLTVLKTDVQPLYAGVCTSLTQHIYSICQRAAVKMVCHTELLPSLMFQSLTELHGYFTI